MIVIAANIVLIIPGYALFSSILPPFVIAHTRVGPAGVGFLKLSNTLFIVIAQLHTTRVVKRMRRAEAFATLCAIWMIALLAVLPATLIHSALAATVLLAGVAIMFAIGECMHAVVIGPLVADLAPADLLGRYMSVFGLMATAGLALGPAIGGVVLATSPDAVWWGGGLVVAVIGAGFLLAGDRVPDHPLATTASNDSGDAAGAAGDGGA
jgi:MFS family permease